MPVVSTLFGDQFKAAQRISRKTASAHAPPDSASLLPLKHTTAQAKQNLQTKNQKHQKRYYQEFASITPTYTTFYSKPLEDYNNRKKIITKPQNKRIDNRSLKRLQKALHYIIMTSPLQYTYCKELKMKVRFKLNFITLTLSQTQIHNDSEIKAKLLDPFLKWIVYKGATGYVWKAECQNNGNIHFHVTTNKYIHWRDLRSYWNALQQRCGYLDSYYNATGHYDANSTDVHAVKKEVDALKYMSKYLIKGDLFKMTKNKKTKRKQFLVNDSCEINSHIYQTKNYRQIECENGEVREYKRQIEGHKFGYSRNLANVKLNMVTSTPEFTEIYDYLNTKEAYTVKFDYVTVLSHNLIDLSNCPIILSEMIHEAVKPKIRKGSRESVINRE